MRRKSNRKRQGLTLLELLIFVGIWAVVSVFTMKSLGMSRILRSNARDRAKMTLIAQSELERIRRMPAQDLVEGMQTRSNPEWPSGVALAVEMTKRQDGTWMADVRVERESSEGKPPVRLTTIRPGGTP